MEMEWIGLETKNLGRASMSRNEGEGQLKPQVDNVIYTLFLQKDVDRFLRMNMI